MKTPISSSLSLDGKNTSAKVRVEGYLDHAYADLGQHCGLCAICVCFAHFTEAVIFKGAYKSFVSVTLASYVEEGKGDKKAIDEEGKQYGGNDGKDYGGGAEADKTEIQGQEHYEQDTCDDDLSGQISETTQGDLSHRILELQMEEQEEPDKVAIFK